MVPQVNRGANPKLSCEDLEKGLWSRRPAELLGRWPDVLVREVVSADIVRLTGTLVVGREGLDCRVAWTFSDDRLAGVSLRPLAGRAALELLVSVLGIDAHRLRPEGDGISCVEVSSTRYDVDRLDGVVSLREVG